MKERQSEANIIESTVDNYVQEQAERVKAALWWIILHESKTDIVWVHFLDKERYEEIKSVFGNSFCFKTLIDLTRSKGMVQNSFKADSSPFSKNPLLVDYRILEVLKWSPQGADIETLIGILHYTSEPSAEEAEENS